MKLFMIGVLLLFCSSFPPVFSRKGSVIGERISLILALAGCLIGFTATALSFVRPDTASLFVSWSVPGAALALKIDGMAAVFLFPAFLIIAAASLYSCRYWPVAKKGGVWSRFFFGLLSTSLVLIPTANNGIFFLVAWEIMALSGFFLVITDRQEEEAQSAAFIYLVATHTGTLALFALFAVIMNGQGDGYLLPASASIEGTSVRASLVFLLALFGFGLKAGIMPFHIWLPKAHAAAPSHVSALMSGVMIKMGIYGIMRVTGFFYNIPPWWGWTVLALGLVSGILGVCYALAQHDIKRLLAYHSVENIGIILLGLGTALLGTAHDVPELVALGMAGALLHVVNHGLFKGLLFLAAGSMIHAVGTRKMSHYGGLLKKMPLTGLFFLGGAVAICGLPPMNGFVSEWLVYLGMLHAGNQTIDGLALGVLLCMPGLAMIGALALLCFTKVFGLCFLGNPRSDIASVREAPLSMLAAMGILLTACFGIGLFPAAVIPLLNGGVKAWQGGSGVRTLSGALVPAGHISLAALLLIVSISVLVVINAIRKSKTVTGVATWGCGYAVPIPRAQYTTSSFAQMLIGWCDRILWTSEIGKREGGLFRRRESFATKVPDMVLDLLIVPAAVLSTRAAVRIRRVVHNGIIGYYLLYFCLALCVLLWLAFSS